MVRTFFDTYSSLGHLLQYDFKNLPRHFPEIPITEIITFLYFMKRFEISFEISVKFCSSGRVRIWKYDFCKQLFLTSQECSK